LTILFLLLAVYGSALGRTLIQAILSGRRNLLVVVAVGLPPTACLAAVDDAVVMVEGCSGVCVDPSGLVLTARDCSLPTTVTVRFKDRTVSATRVYVCREVEGPVVYDCEGDSYPYLPVAATAPQVGERVWSCGYPHLNGRRELRWAKGAMLRWSTFEYAGESFNGNVVAFVTAPGWSGGPLLNAKGEVCGLLNSSDCATSVFISSAAVRQAYAAIRPSLAADSPSRSDKPTLYVFGSMTCGPCRKFKDDYANHAQLRQPLEASFAVEFVDVDKQADLAGQFGVTEVPTFLVPGGLRVSGYEGPDQLLAALGLREQIAARPPPQRDVVDDKEKRPAPATPAPTSEDAAPAPIAPDSPAIAPATPSAVDERLDRLSGLVQTAVSIATWLGVGGATGGAGGLILGGLALWRTLRRRRESRAARDPPPVATPPVIAVDSPPPPQAIVPETRFAPYERDTFAEAFAWAESELVRKYPGAVSTLETLKGLISQFLSAKGINPTK
jgi:thiol-disulfide isomerase/thioredoxin